MNKIKLAADYYNKKLYSNDEIKEVIKLQEKILILNRDKRILQNEIDSLINELNKIMEE